MCGTSGWSTVTCLTLLQVHHASWSQSVQWHLKIARSVPQRLSAESQWPSRNVICHVHVASGKCRVYFLLLFVLFHFKFWQVRKVVIPETWSTLLIKRNPLYILGAFFPSFGEIGLTLHKSTLLWKKLKIPLFIYLCLMLLIIPYWDYISRYMCTFRDDLSLKHGLLFGQPAK